MKRTPLMLAALACSVFWAEAAQGGLLITVGDHVLQTDTPDQKVYIYVTGDTQIQGIQIEMQVADGGPLGGGTIVGPSISSLDVITGTIFANNNTGQSGTVTGQILPQLASRGTTTASGTVLANGLLATAVIDTTGFVTPGQWWELRLTGTLNGDTVSGEIVPTIINGTITLGAYVPEPATLGVVSAGMAMLLYRTQRRHLPGVNTR